MGVSFQIEVLLEFYELLADGSRGNVTVFCLACVQLTRPLPRQEPYGHMLSHPCLTHLSMDHLTSQKCLLWLAILDRQHLEDLVVCWRHSHALDSLEERSSGFDDLLLRLLILVQWHLLDGFDIVRDGLLDDLSWVILDAPPFARTPGLSAWGPSESVVSVMTSTKTSGTSPSLSITI